MANTLGKYPRCKAYLMALKITGNEDGWNDYYSALSIAESFEDKVLTKFGGLNFWTMDGTTLLKRMEEFLENRLYSTPNRAPKKKKIASGSERTPITEAQIIAAQTPKGGWKRSPFESWGVPWPPPKGWRKQIVTHGIPWKAG